MRYFLRLLTGTLAALVVSSHVAAQRAECEGEAECSEIFQVTPDPADPFPATRVGDISAPIRFTVARIKESLFPLLTNIFIHSPSPFPVSDNTCETSPLRHQGDFCTVDVSFAPDETGFFSGKLTFSTLFGLIPFKRVDVTGRGGEPAVSLSATNLNFGDQEINRSSTAQEIELTNSGIIDLTLSTITTGDDFSQTNDCPTTLEPNGRCSINVRFDPTSLGALTGALTLTNDAPDSPQSASLNGVGVAGPVSDLALSATTLDFGTQDINTTSDVYPAVAANVGTVNVTITNIDTSGDFSQTNDCPGVLEPGDDCTLSVSFNPTQPGSLEGSLTVTSNTTDSPQSVHLTGTGIIPGTPNASQSTNEINFGEQIIYTDSEEQVVSITNTGTANLTMGDSLLVGDDTHSFHLIDHCRELIVPIDQSCTLDLIFTPVAAGTFSITLDVVDDSSTSPQKIFVRGVGTEVNSGGCSLRP